MHAKTFKVGKCVCFSYHFRVVLDLWETMLNKIEIEV